MDTLARPAGVPSDVPDSLPILVYTLDAVLLSIPIGVGLYIAEYAIAGGSGGEPPRRGRDPCRCG